MNTVWRVRWKDPESRENTHTDHANKRAALGQMRLIRHLTPPFYRGLRDYEPKLYRVTTRPKGPVDVRAYAQELGTQCALDERARIVAWLRQQAVLRRGLRELTDAIERGEHLKGDRRSRD